MTRKKFIPRFVFINSLMFLVSINLFNMSPIISIPAIFLFPVALIYEFIIVIGRLKHLKISSWLSIIIFAKFYVFRFIIFYESIRNSVDLVFSIFLCCFYVVFAFLISGIKENDKAV